MIRFMKWVLHLLHVATDTLEYLIEKREDAQWDGSVRKVLERRRKDTQKMLKKFSKSEQAYLHRLSTEMGYSLDELAQVYEKIKDVSKMDEHIAMCRRWKLRLMLGYQLQKEGRLIEISPMMTIKN